MEALAAQLGIGVVEHRQVQLGHERHVSATLPDAYHLRLELSGVSGAATGRGRRRDCSCSITDVAPTSRICSAWPTCSIPEQRLHVVTPRAPLTLPGSPGYHWYVVPRVGYPDPDTFRAAYGELASFHDALWERTGIGARAHGVRRVLDGIGDELRAGAGRQTARRRPGSSRSRASFPRSRAGSPIWPRGRTCGRSLPTGARDPIMAVEFARVAKEVLEAGGIEVEYHESDAGHHIDPAHVPAAVEWLRGTLAATDLSGVARRVGGARARPPSSPRRRRRRPA